MAHSHGMGPGALQPGGLDPCSEVSGTAVFHCLISKKITFLLTVKELSPTLKENTTTAASTRARRSHSYRRRAVLGSRPTLSRPHGVTVCSEPHSLAHTKWVPLPCHAHGHPLPGPICPCCAQCPTLRCWTSREPHSAAGFQEIFSPICFLFLFSTLPRLIPALRSLETEGRALPSAPANGSHLHTAAHRQWALHTDRRRQRTDQCPLGWAGSHGPAARVTALKETWKRDLWV